VNRFTFIAAPICGLVAVSAIHGWGVFSVQALDGVGAGLLSVAVPGLLRGFRTALAASTSAMERS
jgi:hypothetical protein